ncbi:unnamed protein product [Rotaria socialis]|uniref:Uncharacterized protein n=2 Tax=Rotaria socialis TaxID=392032 RepID=A0A821MFJ7_9BILA|nr:unnamed protein product [Rotaria socialis]CAF4766617.1 unnamed protein product [Rotaria socialis]
MANNNASQAFTSADTKQESQRQLSDSRTPTNYFILFEHSLSTSSNDIGFHEYLGTRSRNHHHHKLHLPQVKNNQETGSNGTPEEFSNCIKEVLKSIPYDELSSYLISVRMGVSYFFSKRFRFNNMYSINEIQDLIKKKIPTTNGKYYYLPRENYPNQRDDTLRSAFCNVKPISQPREFVEKLEKFSFKVNQQKHVYRVYLQTDDHQTHICTIDPALNYSIVEFSKDFQRTSNIDFIRDRRSSRFLKAKTYDDVFDFRIQFQYNPCTRRDQMATMEYELRQQFPSLSFDFKNENILQPLNNNSIDDQELSICKELCPYVNFIRRDFGDVYQNDGDDELFENFTIFLESSAEYQINREQCTCKRQLDTHGLVYARLNLNTMMSSNGIDEELLILKLWNMGEGLTTIAGQFTTDETQQSTIYHTADGNQYTAHDEALVQRILKQSNLHSALGLNRNATDNEIVQSFNRLQDRFGTKWNSIQGGRFASEKLDTLYKNYFNEPT